MSIERAIVDEVIYELMRLSGQEYVDIYAADAKNIDAPTDSDDSARVAEAAAG